MNGWPTPELRRIQTHLEGLDPVEVALRAIAALDQDQRRDLMDRFNGIYGRCIPPTRLTITRGDAA